MEKERQTKQQTLREQTDGHWRGVGWGWVKKVMGIKEDTCDEYWALYGSDESLNSTPEINIKLYVN